MNKCIGCDTVIPPGGTKCPMCGAPAPKTSVTPVQPKIVETPEIKTTVSDKTCSKCAMVIPAKAKICPYCRKKTGISLAGKLILGLFTLMMAAIVIRTTLSNPPTPVHTASPVKAAYSKKTEELGDIVVRGKIVKIEKNSVDKPANNSRNSDLEEDCKNWIHFRNMAYKLGREGDEPGRAKAYATFLETNRRLNVHYTNEEISNELDRLEKSGYRSGL